MSSGEALAERVPLPLAKLDRMRLQLHEYRAEWVSDADDDAQGDLVARHVLDFIVEQLTATQDGPDAGRRRMHAGVAVERD